jgi:hypothetical protein
MNIHPTEYALTTSKAHYDKDISSVAILKSIANEVFKRELEGDHTAYEILDTVFSKLERSNGGV